MTTTPAMAPRADAADLASLLEAAGGVPAYGNRRNEWDARCAPDQANPEHR